MEDFEDLKNVVLDLGIVAEVIEVDDMESFEDKLLWLSWLQGEKEIKDYNKINETIGNLSTILESDYKTTCRKCGEELVREFSPTDYFFALG